MLSEKIAKAVFNEKFKLDIEDIPVREQLELMRFFVRAEVFSAVMPEKPYIYEILQKMIGKLIKTTDWIPVTEKMPEEEHDTIFAKYWGTDRWNKCMFRKRSDLVEVTVELEDGTRYTDASCTRDGKWDVEEGHGVKKKVVAWKPMSAPWKEGIIG